MTIKQPQENIEVPNAELRAINAVKNQITMGEAEVRRLKGLAEAEEYTVGELNKSKKDLEGNIRVLESSKEQLQIDTESLAGKIVTQRKALEEIKEESEKISKQREEKAEELYERESVVSKREKEATDEEKENRVEIDALKEERKNLDGRKRILDKALSEI